MVISRWKAEFLANAGFVFDKAGKSDEPEVDTHELYAQIGQLKVENEFLKKVSRDLAGKRSGKPHQFADREALGAQAMCATERWSQPAVL